MWFSCHPEPVFIPGSLNIVVEVNASVQPHVIKLQFWVGNMGVWVGNMGVLVGNMGVWVSNGHVPLEYFVSNKSSFSVS